jgi:hypothetical protein
MKCISHYYIELEEKIDINFIFEKCAIDTCLTIPNHKGETKSEFGFLRLTIEFELKNYEALSDAAIFSRPRYLSLLGIISFLLEKPFDVFGLATSSYVFKDGLDGLKIHTVKNLKTEKKNLTNELTQLINALERSEEHEKNLIFSLLDRWRKALFLEKNTEESLLFKDEATLSYFHVLELLGDVYSNSLKNKSKNLIENFVNEFNKEILSFNSIPLESENKAKSKLLSTLLEKDISVGSKILFFLKEFNLFSNKTAFWIKNIIDERNNVAHGRRVHYDKAIFPVQPFFPLNSNNLYPLEFLRVLTAKVISCHLRISAFETRWEEIEDNLIFDTSCAKDFLELKNFPKIEDINEEQQQNIYGGINFFVLNRNIKPVLTEKYFEYYLETLYADEDFLTTNIDAITILYEETKNNELELKLENAIIEIYLLDCNPHVKYRDMRYYLDYNNFDSPKLESLIIEKKIE